MGLIELEIEDLCKAYGQRQAVDHISLRIPQGGLVGLLGPNGAGKSTIINMLSQIVRPSSGNIYWRGKSIYRAHKDMMDTGFSLP